jgi:hypothetical protein
MDALSKAMLLLMDQHLVWSPDFERIRSLLGAMIVAELRLDVPSPQLVALCEKLVADA